MVVPNITATLALFYRTDGILPVVDIVDAVAMRKTTAWESDEGWLQGCDGFSQIFAESILVSLVSIGREE